MTNETDWRLVEETQAGDGQAFDAILERYKRPLLDFVYRMMGDAGEAEDVAQDAFVRAYRAIRAGRVRSRRAAFSTWLFQVARNAARDRLRFRRRRPEVSLAAMEDQGMELAAPGRSPSMEADRRQLGVDIIAALDELPEEQRTALVLFEYEGFSQVEIAGVLRCSEKAVEARIYRARRHLRKRLARWMA